LTTEWQNTIYGHSYGGEAVITFSATESWRLSASYSLLFMKMYGNPPIDTEALEANAPASQFVLRSAYDVTRHLSLDAQLRYVSSLDLIPAYVTADVRLAYRPTANLELSLVGQNLFQASHPEQANTIGVPTVEIPRGYYGKITWHF
jgi:iron complex outermembrane receptor protein